jgi:hypothetical protein
LKTEVKNQKPVVVSVNEAAFGEELFCARA